MKGGVGVGFCGRTGGVCVDEYEEVEGGAGDLR